MQDATAPSLWSGSAFGSFEWGKYGSADELSLEPGFLLGVAPNISLGATTSFIDDGDGWKYQSVSPFVHVQVTPSTWPVRVALYAGYEFADRSAETPARSTAPASAAVVSRPPRRAGKSTGTPATPAPSIGAGSGTDTGGGDTGGPVVCGPDYGPDAPPCDDEVARLRVARHAGHTTPEPTPVPTPAAATTAPPTSKAARKTQHAAPIRKSTSAPAAQPAAYDGIHRHGENHAFTRLIVEADLTARDKAIINLIGIWPQDGKPAWGYAGGVRHSFSHAWAAGLEAIGDFDAHGEHELVLGGYWSPTHHATLKLGIGTGLTEASPDFSLRTGLVWRF